VLKKTPLFLPLLKRGKVLFFLKRVVTFFFIRVKKLRFTLNINNILVFGRCFFFNFVLLLLFCLFIYFQRREEREYNFEYACEGASRASPPLIKHSLFNYFNLYVFFNLFIQKSPESACLVSAISNNSEKKQIFYFYYSSLYL